VNGEWGVVKGEGGQRNATAEIEDEDENEDEDDKICAARMDLWVWFLVLDL